MRIVDHDGSLILLSEACDFREVGDVAIHAEYAINHNEANPIGFTQLQRALERRHIIVFVLQGFARLKP